MSELQLFGIIKEFEWDLTAAASPSGQHPRICPECKGLSHYSKEMEMSLVDEEALFLIQKLKQIIDSVDFDVSEIKENINNLSEYKGKSFRYGLDIVDALGYAHQQIEEKGK